jgi:hypothetical protein
VIVGLFVAFLIAALPLRASMPVGLSPRLASLAEGPRARLAVWSERD